MVSQSRLGSYIIERTVIGITQTINQVVKIMVTSAFYAQNVDLTDDFQDGQRETPEIGRET